MMATIIDFRKYVDLKNRDKNIIKSVENLSEKGKIIYFKEKEIK